MNCKMMGIVGFWEQDDDGNCILYVDKYYMVIECRTMEIV